MQTNLILYNIDFFRALYNVHIYVLRWDLLITQMIY